MACILHNGRQVGDAPSDEPPLDLQHAVERAAHLLPSQGPIEVFVHHNTLHAFEHCSFHEAVQAGAARFGGNPYLSEQQYRELLRDGRINNGDLQAVIHEDLEGRELEPIDGLGTRAEIRMAMLRHPLQIGPDAELRWVVAESDALERFRPETPAVSRERILEGSRAWLNGHNSAALSSVDDLDELLDKLGRQSERWSPASWESFSLHLLWRLCRQGIQSLPATETSHLYVRPRDRLLRAVGEDIDRNVQDVLIRFCGAYLDQGYSDWSLPYRERGFYESFLALYSQSSRTSPRWMRRLPIELTALRDANVSAEQSIEDSLSELGIAADDREEFIAQSLLALRGWGGMVWQLESGVDWVAHPIPKGSLIGLLAVQLILEREAIRHVGDECFGESSSVASVLELASHRLAPAESMNVERRAFLLFQVAQSLGWKPQQLAALSDSDWRELVAEMERFSLFERRRIYHEAYERQYRDRALNALGVHARHRKSLSGRRSMTRPDFQVLTCIDDREESFRRHLEEVHPSCETLGAAGFFAVAINYRGAADGYYKPLCPAVITPSIFVQEDVGYTFEGVHRNRTELRRRLGLASRFFQRRSRSFFGGIAAGLVGSLATAPLVAQVLFPHLTSRIRLRFGSLLQPPPVTRLQLERYAEGPGPTNGHIGYTTDEMAQVVVRLLQDIGVTETGQFSRLFIVCGHGSSSLNNPHESAYCCGACAGKRGGPNARAFAEMANDWRVRTKVAQKGIRIPDNTVFVGAYHNTCDDSVVFFDLDQLPASHRGEFETARRAIEEARRRNAHERCRRFDSAPLTVSPDEALKHVEARAHDISQVRPEYNHATIALCIVGRRDWTRGLFLDRRAFLVSYDPAQDDDDSTILLRILAAAIPVCAGISLEYYFSCVDHTVYGAGSKLPHNIVSLLGVMEGTSSDLRTGLYQQMVEIHEPMRLLFIVECTTQAMLSIILTNEPIGRLCRGDWVHVAVMDAETSEIQLFRDGAFEPFPVGASELQEVLASQECYQGHRDHRPFFSIVEPGEGQ